MSWHYLPELEAEYSEENSLDGEPCAPLKSTHSVGRCCSDAKWMDAYRSSLSGMMSPHLMENPGQERWMCSQEGSPARTFQSVIETQKESKEVVQDCGQKCLGSFARFNQNTSLWKTAQLSLFEDLGESLEIWPYQGEIVDGAAYGVQMLEETICETESGFIPTPRASMGKPCSKRIGIDSEEYRHNIEEYLGGRPNPTFCEWMMGWPLTWTDVTKPLETARFQQWLRSHGVC